MDLLNIEDSVTVTSAEWVGQGPHARRGPMRLRILALVGSALIVSVVDEEDLADGPLVEHDGEPRRLRDFYTPEAWWPIRSPDVWASRHPDAYFALPVPVADLWDPPSERSLLTRTTPVGDRWAAHARAVAQSLDSFLNARLARLAGALRTGRWVLDHVRVAVTSIAGSSEEDDANVDDSEIEEQLCALEDDLRRLYRHASDLASAAEELRVPEASRAASVRDVLGALVDGAPPE